MTQEVQPLTWQKRTNIEEHQQFFSKINEIIDNLAPTVDEAEAAIAQATQALADANAAIATANAASAAASAAASQAQTAASTVAGYDTRLTAAEGDIDALQAADQTMAGNIAALGTRMTAAESKNSQQDTAIGALQTADSQNVKINRINEYAVGLTGNQSGITGNKGFLGNIQVGDNDHPLTGGFVAVTNGAYRRIRLQNIADDATIVPASSVGYPIVAWTDVNDQNICTLVAQHQADGKTRLVTQLRNPDGTNKLIVLGVSD